MDVEDEDTEVPYIVSSRHLALASPWFKRVLSRDSWAGPTRDAFDGRFHISTGDWDADAFLLVLSICHLRNETVPKTIELKI